MRRLVVFYFKYNPIAVMFIKLRKKKLKININEPIQRTGKFLDEWLRSNNLILNKTTHKRISVLIAHYFENEDEVSRALVFNFLNMAWQNKFDISPDNLEARQAQIQSLMEQSKKKISKWWYTGSLAILLLLLTLSFIYMPRLSTSFYQSKAAHEITQNMPISDSQANELKDIVKNIVKAESRLGKNTSYNSVWKNIKSILGVRSYKNIPRHAFEDVKKMLQERDDLTKALKLNNCL